LYVLFFACKAAWLFFGATFPHIRPSASTATQVTNRQFWHRKDFTAANDVGICFGCSAMMSPLQLFFVFLQSVLRQTVHVLQLGAAHCGWQQSVHFMRRPG